MTKDEIKQTMQAAIDEMKTRSEDAGWAPTDESPPIFVYFADETVGTYTAEEFRRHVQQVAREGRKP